MADTTQQRAAELFKAALGQEPAARAAFLDEQCGADAELRRELESLLTADTQAGGFLEKPPEFVQSLAASEPDARLGQRVGGYRIVRQIASGGMGTVYEAVQERLGRTVALKVIRRGSASPAALRRFEYEAKMLARLQHPAIAHIYEVGTHVDREGVLGSAGAGIPFFAMEYVPNARTVVDYVREERLTTHQRLELFAQVCDAVHYGHQRGVIHRDLKPTNILVGDEGRSEPPMPVAGDVSAEPARRGGTTPRTRGQGSDARPQSAIPKVIDFGVARAVDAEQALTTLHTSYGQLIGTLQYMSPEQCGPDPQDVDVRSDIYSLGVVLYEVLCGRPPYAVQQMTLLEATRVIREELPPRLSAVDRTLRGDLDTIVRKALEKDRGRRYETAGELARDMRHYLADEPIEAKRDSAWYVVRKTLIRHRRVVAVAAGFALLIIAATVALIAAYARQGRLLVGIQEQRDKALSAEQLADQRFRQAEYESYAANIAAASAAIAASDGGAALARLQVTPEALRNWEWHYLFRQADQSVWTWQGPKELIASLVRLTPDGRFVGASFWMEQRAGAIWVWPSGTRRGPLGGPAAQRPAGEARPGESGSNPVGKLTLAESYSAPFAFSADSAELVTGDREGTVSWFDIPEWRETNRSQITVMQDGAVPIGLSPDGRIVLLATGTSCRLWDATSRRLLHELIMPQPDWIGASGFDAACNRVALGSGSGNVWLWDVRNGQELAQIPAHTGTVYGVAFSSDGRLLATAGGESGELKLWELSSPGDSTDGPHEFQFRLLHELRGGTQRVGSLAFSPDGRVLAGPSHDKTVRVWNVADGTLQATLLGHTTGVVCTAFSSDGRFLVSGAREGVVKLWDLQQAPSVRVFRELPAGVSSIRFTPDQARLLLRCGIACVIDANTGKQVRQFGVSQEGFRSGVLVGPGSSQITLATMDGSIGIWDIGTGQETRVIGAHRSAPFLAADPSGRVLASADADAVVLWDWNEAGELRRFAGPGESVSSLAISPDAAQLAVGLSNGELFVLDAHSGQRTTIEPGSGLTLMSVAFSPDGQQLAAGSSDGTVKLWDPAAGRLAWSASPQLGDVWCMAFSPDGTRLAAGGRNRSVRVFDVQTARELLALRGPTGTVMCVAFSPDGQSIAAGSWAREVFIWDAASSQR